MVLYNVTVPGTISLYHSIIAAISTGVPVLLCSEYNFTSITVGSTTVQSIIRQYAVLGVLEY